MTVSARKITAFAKLVAGLADTPNLGSTTLLKQWFDSSPEELRVAFNGLIDDLIATAAGASGTEQIGSAPISGVAGSTAYAQLVDLKNQLNGVVLGQIPDGSLDYVKLNAASKDLITEYGLSRQALINGNFDIWQRGTSFDVTSNSYTADRWKCTSAGATYNVSRQSITDLVGSNYCMRVTYKTAGSNDVYLSYGFEFDDFKKLKGKKATVSFYARKTGTPLTFIASLKYSASESNIFNGTLIGTTPNLATTLTNTWVKYSMTVDMPLISDTNQGLQLVFQCPSTNLNDYIEIAQALDNVGGTALPFQPKSFAEELALCQRYYEKSYDYATLPGFVNYAVQPILFSAPAGLAASTAGNVGGVCLLPFKVRKRINPTATLYDFDGTANAVRVVPTDAKRAGVTGIANLKDTGTFQYLSFDNSSPTAISTGNTIGASWTVDAEL